jgi:hypothetical protein
MSRATRGLLGLVLALLAGWVAPTTAGASEGTLTVRPRVLHPGERVTFCGTGFSPTGDRVVSSGIDGRVGPHAAAERDGSACLDLAYSDFRMPHDRYVPLFLSAQGADGGLRTDTGRVYLSDGRLPGTGPDLLVPAADLAAGLLAVGLGLVTLAGPGTSRSRRLARPSAPGSVSRRR